MTAAFDDVADPIDQLRAVDELARRLPQLPDAYLRDETGLGFLAAVTRASGRDPYPPPGSSAALAGIQIYLDPDMPPDVLELRWRDGSRAPERIYLGLLR